MFVKAENFVEKQITKVGEIIFVSNEAKIYGAKDMHILNSAYEVPKKPHVKKAQKPTKKVEVIANLVKAHLESKEIVLQKIIYNTNLETEEISFHEESPQEFLNLTLAKMGRLSSNISNYYSKISALPHFWVKVLTNYKIQLDKQKFYTSLSYLQFGKYRSSSLRGPPSYMIF